MVLVGKVSHANAYGLGPENSAGLIEPRCLRLQGVAGRRRLPESQFLEGLRIIKP